MGSKPARTSESIKFGDAFEIDVHAYRLRRAGHLVKLERIPMELLFLLVEQRGQLVSREQIVERIWGKGVFFDADNSINGAIRKIRQVLRDDPEQPRFVQTITGKGYRFIAPVVEHLVAENSQSQVLIEETLPPVSRRMWSRVLLGTATLLVAIGVYAARI